MRRKELILNFNCDKEKKNKYNKDFEYTESELERKEKKNEFSVLTE